MDLLCINPMGCNSHVWYKICTWPQITCKWDLSNSALKRMIVDSETSLKMSWMTYLHLFWELFQMLGPYFHDSRPNLGSVWYVSISKLLSKNEENPTELWRLNNVEGLCNIISLAQLLLGLGLTWSVPTINAIKASTKASSKNLGISPRSPVACWALLDCPCGSRYAATTASAFSDVILILSLLHEATQRDKCFVYKCQCQLLVEVVKWPNDVVICCALKAVLYLYTET